jgi:hypothetical protein
MARYARRIPAASARAEPVCIDEEGWRRIENGYGRTLPDTVRQQLLEATEEYVRFGSLESEAAKVSDARDQIVRLQGAAGRFAEALNAAEQEDAGFYAVQLIDKAVKRAPSGSRGALTTRKLSTALWRFQSICSDALKDLEEVDGWHRPGTRWRQWIGRLTQIVRSHKLPYGVRKDVDKQKTGRPSGFVLLVGELQSFLPHQPGPDQ